ncbi:MAG: gamma-glutamyltransferase [Pirellulales bacterium]
MATDAALAAMRRGGNAVDGAVAAALTLGVVDNHNSGLGGGCFILLRLAGGRRIAIDGRETAPARATRDMFLRDGKPQPAWSRTGPLATGVPGALAAYALAVGEYGRLELADLLLPAAQIAEAGFAIDRVYAGNLRRTAAILAQFPVSRVVLLKPNGVPYIEGETLRQPDLARTYRAIARGGIDWFYRGPFADRVGRWMADHGGILSAADFASYRAIRRQPIETTYRDLTLLGFPPPSSGGIHVAQILNILENFDVEGLARSNPALQAHLMAEAMKLAFADRAHWLGDADFVSVPRGLIDKTYAAALARRIDLRHATAVPTHATPPHWRTDPFGPVRRTGSSQPSTGSQVPSVQPPSTAAGKHTTHIAAADAEGNWVAITATVNTSFGSKVIVPGTGVVLNNEMDDFAIAPGVPNAFGLLGAEANAIAPGKRPLSSMSPTIVLRDGQPILTLGAAGGPKIITQVVSMLVRKTDLAQSLEDALASPRLHHQWRPDQLYLEDAFPELVADQLRRWGHTIRRTGQIAVVQAIAFDPQRNVLIGYSDPRVPGKAAGF